MRTDRDATAGVEWAGRPDEDPPELERDARGWPILRASDPCDGFNSRTKCRCVLHYHRGFHRDVTGAEWLDD